MYRSVCIGTSSFFLAVLHVVSAVAGRIDQRADRSKENYSFGQAARAMIDEC